jgi:hypothetical protein
MKQLRIANCSLQLRVVFDALGLALEHRTSLNLHCVCIAQPFQQALFTNIGHSGFSLGT